MSVTTRLTELGIVLPQVNNPKYAYLPFKRAGDMVFISGMVPRLDDGSFLVGQVGSEVSVEQGIKAARLCALHILAVAQTVTGSLDDVDFLRVNGMVNAAPMFGSHAQVLEGCSSLILSVMGNRGTHSRTAVGMGSLPLNVSVEIEATVRIIS
ncbi:hypothetical protein A8A54_19180 [Brucella pseudogrignonensis]|uniref:RidA family protein n=1 Tax=Brucella pseudogrignonensis TaxID=419475 RepID=UPI0007DA5422|nr:RidA family protein [Brucella pseudogrignonensis]ANG98731.1 hypothetical protein A8A54_19180 [Brucella pseudogrignonensis]